MNEVISVENLGKKYIISHNVNANTTFREMITENVKKIFKSKLFKNSTKEEFWALKNLSLKINKGDRLGVIGRNGAGKSTFLKLLSRITEPTEGKIRIKGKIASLLEVGTGFHPELTGRENIYLNGAILGMARSEIKKKFDDIVAFSGVENFLDTPVKRYSSGMYVRLAFAVAAHLEPEILIIDEVLAVGDIEFQKKCIGRMDSLSKEEGRTIIFVSHNIGAVRKLCNRGILLENGLKTLEGDMNRVVDKYVASNSLAHNKYANIIISEIGVTINKIVVNEAENGKVFPFKPLRIDIEMDAVQDVSNIGIQITISHNDVDGMVFTTNTSQTKGMDIVIKKGNNHFVCLIESFNLCSGTYRLGFALDIPFVKFYFCETDLFTFDVEEIIPEKSRLSTLPVYGHVYLDHRWIVQS